MTPRLGCASTDQPAPPWEHDTTNGHVHTTRPSLKPDQPENSEGGCACPGRSTAPIGPGGATGMGRAYACRFGGTLETRHVYGYPLAQVPRRHLNKTLRGGSGPGPFEEPRASTCRAAAARTPHTTNDIVSFGPQAQPTHFMKVQARHRLCAFAAKSIASKGPQA